ncbi:xylulokinase [Hahella sp. CCB-MM4]|uniref:xylulokinase n=1 Tax=Hahella sp. (strain CCB-MM4) TaxID=1926491 RepID=UPI000B9AC027|nr:xylulokinase [Hahella sp. CCB-MM4]OZG69986.1 xylulokinase [Hahella sp. CCB-MM4]
MYLGIDCGTQGTKAVILDPEKALIIGEGYASHQMISGSNGCREQEPSWWVEALIESYRKALDQAGVSGKQITAIGVSGQQHGLVILDSAGEVIRPAKLWCDTETSQQNSELLTLMGGEQGALAQLGLVLATGYTLSKLLWLKQVEPESFNRIEHILLPHDYLNYWLTGEMASEFGDASGTGYFDIRRREWNLDVLTLVDDSGRLPKSLPPLLEAHQSIGRIRPEVAKLLGLEESVIVASGGGDNMMGAIGTGNIQNGVVTMSLGTSGAVYACSEQPLQSLHPLVASFCSSSNGWLPLICTMNLTGAANSVRHLFGLELDEFNDRAARSPIGAEGITLLPFFNGERVPALPDASGSLLGMNSQNLNPSNLCRAVLEGTTFGLRYGLDLLRESGIKTREIRLIGGGAKSPFWRQMVADIMDTRVVCPTLGEAGALGGAIQAAWCESHLQGRKESLSDLCGRYVVLDESSAVEPSSMAVGAYQEAYDLYRQRLTSAYPQI